MTIGIIFALAAMVFWGFEEFFLKQAIGGLRSITTMLINTVSGGILSMVVILFFFTKEVSWIGAQNFIFASTAAVTAFLGYIFLYFALEKQEVSLVASLDESWIVIAVLIAVVAFGEHLSALHIISISAVIIGAILISVDTSALRKLSFISGSGYTSLAILFTGITVPLEKILIARIGEINSIIYLYALYLPLVFIGRMISKEKFVRPTLRLLKIAILSGLADGAAFAFYVFAINKIDISYVAPIVASNVLVTIILAKLYLKEKMTAFESVGVVLILGGVIALSTIIK